MQENRELPDNSEHPPRFAKGSLVWRQVLCSSNREIRNKLVLELPGAAFSGYGIELHCRRVHQFVPQGEASIDGQQHTVFLPELDDGITRIQKICHHAHSSPNDAPRAPLYFPRPTSIQGSHIQLSTTQNYAFFIIFPEVMRITGVFRDFFIMDPVTGEVGLREVLEMSVRDKHEPGKKHVFNFLMDPINKIEDETSKLLKGAIHGEVRRAYRLSRINAATPDQDPIYERIIDREDALAACLMDPDVAAQHSVVAIKTVRKKAIVREPTGHENPRQEITSMYNIDRYHGEAARVLATAGDDGAMVAADAAEGNNGDEMGDEADEVLKSSGQYDNVVKLLYCAVEDFPACMPSTPTNPAEAGAAPAPAPAATPAGATGAAAMDMEGSSGSGSDNDGRLLLSQTNQEGNAYLVLPFYTDGELFDHLGTLPDNYRKVHACFGNLVQGLKEMHLPRYNHRDLSCENVMVHTPNKYTPSRGGSGASIASSSSASATPSDQPPAPPQARPQQEHLIIDMGMSKHVPQGSLLYGPRVCGKVLYVPAEHFLCSDHNVPTTGFAADIWALGVILYIIVTGRGPFNNENPADTTGLRNNYIAWLRSIVNSEIGNVRCRAKPVVISDHEKGAIPREVLDSPRPPRLKNHPCYNVLRGMLTWPEADRISLERILQDEWVCYGGVSQYIGTHNPVAAAAPAPSAPPAAP